MILKKILFGVPAIFVYATSHDALAVDAESFATKNKKYADWFVIEFAGPKKIIYRLATESVNYGDKYTLAFDFDPSKNCIPKPATIIAHMGSYTPSMADGYLVMKYKIPGQKESRPDIFKTYMSNGDTFGFIETKFTVNQFSGINNKGRLAIWVAPSGDGAVARGPNIYFSFNGFSKANKESKKNCLAQR